MYDKRVVMELGSMKLGRLHPALTWDATPHTFRREYSHIIIHGSTVACVIRTLRIQYHVSIVSNICTYIILL
jgi:hypothetical protein